MHKVLERYFALEKALKEGIRSSHKPEEPWPVGSIYTDCPPCYAKEGWDEKLGLILQQHGVNLEQFAQEHFATFGGDMFVVREGKLKFKDTCRCVSMEALLKTAAKQLKD